MQYLQMCDKLTVRQHKEMLEVFTGFETKNRYKVFSKEGRELYFAAEVKGSWLIRNFLGAFRPFTIELIGVDKQLVMRLTRPFTFIFHKVEAYDKQGLRFGYVQRQFSFLRRIYYVFDEQGNKMYELIGPILKPWTLFINKDGQQLGKLVKRWSGLAKEMFTDADHFDLDFPLGADVKHKALLLAAVFLVDFVQFESKKK